MKIVTGIDAADDSRVLWIATPDGDIYPEKLMVPPLAAIAHVEEDQTFSNTARRPSKYVLRENRGFASDRPAGEATPLLCCRALGEADAAELATLSPGPVGEDGEERDALPESGPRRERSLLRSQAGCAGSFDAETEFAAWAASGRYEVGYASGDTLVMEARPILQTVAEEPEERGRRSETEGQDRDPVEP